MFPGYMKKQSVRKFFIMSCRNFNLYVIKSFKNTLANVVLLITLEGMKNIKKLIIGSR